MYCPIVLRKTLKVTKSTKLRHKYDIMIDIILYNSDQDWYLDHPNILALILRTISLDHFRGKEKYRTPSVSAPSSVSTPYQLVRPLLRE